MSLRLYGCESWTLTQDLEKLVQTFENKCYSRMVLVSCREHKTNEYLFGNRSFTLPNVISAYCQTSSVASYHGLAMSADMTRCRKPYFVKRRNVAVTEEDRANYGRTISSNGQASHCRRCCASHTTKMIELLVFLGEAVSPFDTRTVSVTKVDCAKTVRA